MVCSKVSSQHRVFSNVHQHRSWAPSNAEVHCREPETSEGNWLGNTTPGGHLWSSKGYACSGYANVTSPFKSSWIQRLILPHHTSVEQPQPLDKLNRENHGIGGVQTNWKENADYLTVLGNQSDFPVYENSRRSKQDFFSSHQTFLGTNTLGCVRSGVNIASTSTLFEAPDALPPEIQVSPKPLPVVESLLPGCSKKVTENQTFTETNMSHILSRCTGFVNPMNQTVHYSANEKARVSCSSIEGLNSRSVVCAAGDLLALKSLQIGKRCADPSQPFSEFPFNSIDAVTRSNMDPTYGGSVGRCQSVENRLLDVYSMPYRAEGIELFQECFSQANLLTSKTDERLPLGFSTDQFTRPKTISKRNCWNPKERHSYARDGSEALYAREGSFDGEKDGPQQISNLVSLHGGANVAKEQAGVSSSHQMIEQELGSSHGSHEEQGGTSRSFSFHFENKLASELDHGKGVTRKGQWPFGPSTLSNEDLVQSRWSEENRARGLPEATRSRLPLNNSSIVPETGVCEAGTAYIGRSRCSPFFGTENLNESASRMISDNHDVSSYEAACIDIIGEMNTAALSVSSVDQARQEKARSLPGGCKLSRLESNSMIEGMEGKELMSSLPSRTVSVNNWKSFKPSISSTGSIGSCSKTPANLCIKDPPTSFDARSRPTTQEKPAAFPSGVLQRHLHSSQRQCAGTGVNAAPDDRESEGREALGWEGPGLAVKQNIWLQRWSTMSSRKVQAVSMLNREGGVPAGMTRARNYFEDYSTSQGSRESSYRFDLRPAKRVCYEKRSGLGIAMSKIGSVAVGREHNEKGVTSHFMKRFFSPSVAAMAIMGMTARTQPQRTGLFGVWVSNASVRKPSTSQAEVCKDFLTRPNYEKVFLQSAAKAPSNLVDL